MNKIVPFQRRLKRGSWKSNKLPLGISMSIWRRRRSVWKVRYVMMGVLFGTFAALYVAAPVPINSNNIQQLASNTSSNVAAISMRFELCGSGKRTNCVVDGDTIWYGGVKIRLASIDAPELLFIRKGTWRTLKA